MNIIDWAKAAFKGWMDLDGPFGGGVTYGNRTIRGLPSEREALDSSTIVGACLETIVNAFTDATAATFVVKEDGDEQYDHTTPFALMMLSPDPLRKITGRRLARAMVASYETDGNAYADLLEDATGTVREMRWIPHWKIKPIADLTTDLLDHYDVTMADGTIARREPNEVLHIAKGIDPQNPLKGVTALKTALRLILTDNECDAYLSEVVVNPAIVGFTVTPKEAGMTPEDAEAIERKIMTKFGRGGRGGVMVPHFPSDFSRVGFSPAELGIDTMRRTPEARISALMDVPAIVAGLEVGLDRSTFSNTEQARKYFARNKMSQLWDTFGEAYSFQVLPRCEGFQKGQRAGYDTRKIADLQEDQDALATRVSTLFEGNVILRKEARSMLGLKPGAGDDVYAADITQGAASTSLDQTKNRLADRRRAAEALRKTQDGTGA